jgi:hypothetical protein
VIKTSNCYLTSDCESQSRNTNNIKKKGKNVSSKCQNFIIKDLKDSEVDEISNNELKTMMIRMANEVKRTYISTSMNSKRIQINN